MTTTVTMLQTRQGEGGSLWTVGNSYAASDAFATVLINSNYATGTLPKSRGLVPVNAQTDSNGQITALVDGAGNSYPLARGVPILAGASAGADSGWLPINAAPERFAYQLDSGSTTTTFSIDISADGVTSLGQAFTGTWASSSSAEITPQIMFSNPLAKFFRWNVVSGGPLSVNRGM